jgi:hypothetical protein
MLAFTLVVFAADAAKTDGWTLPRQNLGTISGDVGCGLADGLAVPVRDSARPLGPDGTSAASAVPDWVPATPVEGLPRFALGPTREAASVTPWFELRGETRFGLFFAGTPGPADRLELELRGRRGGTPSVIGRKAISTAFAFEAGSNIEWRFVAAGELPGLPEAEAIRVLLRGAQVPSAPLAVTAPVSYDVEHLSRRLSDAGAKPLVFPNLVTYFPCVGLPRLGGGIVEPPTQILVPSDEPSPVREPDTSPFAGALDLYRLERLPLADSTNPPSRIAVFDVDQRIPGGTELAPTTATVVDG